MVKLHGKVHVAETTLLDYVQNNAEYRCTLWSTGILCIVAETWKKFKSSLQYQFGFNNQLRKIPGSLKFIARKTHNAFRVNIM